MLYLGPHMLSMTWIELIAASLGALSVYLMTQQRPAAWPIGLAMILLYIWIFMTHVCTQKWRYNLRHA